MEILSFCVGPYMENTYVVGDPASKEAVVIDPGGESDKILAEVKKKGWRVTHLFHTHGHGDHLMGTPDMKEATGAKLWIHQDDAHYLDIAAKNMSEAFGLPVAAPKADAHYQDGQEIAVGGLKFKVLHTPGHTMGGVCFLVENSLFSGDTLFALSIGRSDMPGGSSKTLLKSIKNKLLNLPDNTEVFPGHGDTTTIGQEKRQNPFLMDLDDEM